MKTLEKKCETSTGLLSTRIAAQTLGVSVSFMNRHRRTLPGRHRAGRVFRWDVDALRLWMFEQAQEEVAQGL